MIRSGSRSATLSDNKSAAVKFAEQAYPLRIAEIVASFPYKDQVREFREKLRLPSDAAVLSELSLEEDKDGRKQNAFRFLGVTIQRRQLDAAGQAGRRQGRLGDARPRRHLQAAGHSRRQAV